MSVYKNQWFAMLRTEFDNDNGWEPETSSGLVNFSFSFLFEFQHIHKIRYELEYDFNVGLTKARV